MMEKKMKSSAATNKVKKKMTKEQIQLAIIRKKECDAKALSIVERLLEPDIDPDWLTANLKDINRCHMEDVIEERAIVKLCGYVLCQKPLTVVYNQRYHISLRDKKVYDVTKRKNFCSPSCFGASNYLLEQMLTSPLWLRDNEDIPEFRILHKERHGSNIPHNNARGEEVNIVTVKSTNKEGTTQDVKIPDPMNNEEKSPTKAEEEIDRCIENFVLEAVQNFELKGLDSSDNKSCVSSDNQTNSREKLAMEGKDVKTTDETEKEALQINKESQAPVKSKNYDSTSKNSVNQLINNSARIDSKKRKILENKTKTETRMGNDVDISESTCTDDDAIEQCVYPIEDKMIHSNLEYPKLLKKNQIETNNVIEQFSYTSEDDSNKISSLDVHSSDEKKEVQDIESDKSSNNPPLEPTRKKKKEKASKKPVEMNLAARVETSLHEWVTDQTVDYLFGDESVKEKLINAIEVQENYQTLCRKLDRLQVQEEREDAEVLEKPALKPAPHFAVLKEEGEKLDIKVRAFYGGKTTFEEPPKPNGDEESSDKVETFLPLTESFAPQIIRRKIFLEKLDHILPDLLRTLAGNNDVYARASLNYSSLKCTAIKALLHTFSLSATNIVFKTAEWTLVGLVIIKMLSLSDPYLANLLATKQANLYISMILTAYKLNSDYLNLLVASLNPNMNPR